MSALPAPGGLLTERVLLVRVGEARLAIESRHVRGVVPVGDPTPIPRAPAHVVGLLHNLGRVVPLVDVRPALGLPAEAAPRRPETLALLLEAPPWYIAVELDEVVGFETSRPSPALPPPGTVPEPVRAYAKGSFSRDDCVYALLDTWRLMEAIRVG